MKNLIQKALVIVLCNFASAAFSATYSCKSDFDRKLYFKLSVSEAKAEISTENVSCKLLLDESYRPTVKYAGYSRFLMQTQSVSSCKKFMEDMLGHGSFVSLKVSGEVKKGKAKGASTFVYDDGEFHGELENERVNCTKN